MASKPGILTEWPWTWLGNFKYVVLAPWVVHSTYSYMVKDESERDLSYFLILPLLLSRMVHNQIWISLSRYRTAKGNNRIIDKSIEFEQVDRERNCALTLLMGNTSILSIAIYLTFIDFMNNMGHCNFEHVPKRLFSLFPPLKYLIYTPSFLLLKIAGMLVNILQEKGQNALAHQFRGGPNDEGLNGNGDLFLRKHPKLKVKLVDGSSLVVATVLNSIPKGTTQVLLQGKLSKVANSIALALCQGGIQVYTTSEDEYEKLKSKLSNEAGNNLVLSKHSAPKTWLVGDDLSEDEQKKASKGTTFILFSRFPPKKTRKDCVYLSTPAMYAPKHLENVDSCENWLPRRVMSAWRIAGILHAMEEWNVHECGNMMFDIEKIWQASLAHGFRPLTNVAELKPN
ncbi:UNVERIFIED_CONTAM: Very-long-chain aldehyde decarbonylase CER1 [Sesamum latifolium]|uniref:Very-long-chain aldehyde decarbonylase CER1 n=1 Tax=Sesamum latifolium TaxID=2727402 RepID=A0AAW2U509_9LAMI